MLVAWPFVVLLVIIFAVVPMRLSWYEVLVYIWWLLVSFIFWLTFCVLQLFTAVPRGFYDLRIYDKGTLTRGTWARRIMLDMHRSLQEHSLVFLLPVTLIAVLWSKNSNESISKCKHAAAFSSFRLILNLWIKCSSFINSQIGKWQARLQLSVIQSSSIREAMGFWNWHRETFP